MEWFQKKMKSDVIPQDNSSLLEEKIPTEFCIAYLGLRPGTILFLIIIIWFSIKWCQKKKKSDTIPQETKNKLKETKNKLKVAVDLTFFVSPQDGDFTQNLIGGTERLLQTLPDYVVEILTPEWSKEDDSTNKIRIVAYLTQERNKTEFEEMMKCDQGSVCILFLPENRSLPNIPLDRKHIIISFRKYPNIVKCSFYDDSQKNAWNNLLRNVRKGDEGEDDKYGSPV
ncbi:uncharacterized protein LOC110454230 [Mizuhopecten yessoensis]|uniref:uncharacterized protein LOC110454230 n=1 Tax=Mizuhopecten yessoensis TaxID=6573 RepID=UPI000B45A8DC|nr:uncharacterized protein LOC110454230 [Mizuhopecten yessoensis]